MTNSIKQSSSALCLAGPGRAASARKQDCFLGNVDPLGNQIGGWVKTNILDLPNDTWPLALVALCGGILAFVILGSLVKSISSIFCPNPTTEDRVPE
jgi:hypothetical protein